MKICQNCKYFDQCGDLERTEPCKGFENKSKLFEDAVNRYNHCMFVTCYEYNTIGTDFSEHTECWNIRDMVAEVDYILSTYHEEGHCNYEMKNGDFDDKIAWINETNMLKGFIRDYEPFVKDVKCHIHHCSKYDN